MNMNFEDQIRERAYHIWLAAGMADGQAVVHWVRAEQAVIGEKAISVEAAEPVIIITKAAPKAKPSKAAKPAAAKVVGAKAAGTKAAGTKAPGVKAASSKPESVKRAKVTAASGKTSSVSATH